MNLRRNDFIRRRVFLLTVFCFAVLSAFFSADVLAETTVTPTSNAQVVKKGEKKTSLNFEDELVEGAAAKPELFYLFQKKNFNYKRLIRLRENFLPEMRKTSEDIQRVRSSN